MHIVRSRVMGICSGVQSAILKVEEAIRLGKAEGLPVYTIGPLIHNEQYLARLASQGVGIVTNPEDAEPGIAVIRAHGIPGGLRTSFEEAGYRLVDGTCPRVLRSQRIVRERTDAGDVVVLVGDPGHGEVTAVAGAAADPSRVRIIHGLEEVSSLTIDRPVTLLSQTTFSSSRFDGIAAKLQLLSDAAGFPLTVVRSICPSTSNRQQALTELCSRVEAVIVIGGKGSSNTRRLYELAAACTANVWHINSPEEVTADMCVFREIGVTAGASTPDWLIEAVEGQLRNMA